MFDLLTVQIYKLLVPLNIALFPWVHVRIVEGGDKIKQGFDIVNSLF